MGGLIVKQGGRLIESDVLSVCKQVEELDASLSVYWNDLIQRFQIYREFGGDMHLVMTVKNTDGSFRPLDGRVVTDLILCDTQKGYNPLQVIEESEKKAECEQEKNQSELIEEEIAPRLKFALKKDLDL